MKTQFKIILAGIFLGAMVLNTAAQDVITIIKDTKKLIPISITGFTKEAKSVLEFDLSVLGM